MNFDKISKIPSNIASPKNIIDIKKSGKKIIIKYEQDMLFSDNDVQLKEDRVITIFYPKKIRGFEVQVDEDDNIFVAVIYKPPFTFFGWSFTKAEHENNTNTTSAKSIQ
jgi:hypothetical protein